jgi:hypothetical protein
VTRGYERAERIAHQRTSQVVCRRRDEHHALQVRARGGHNAEQVRDYAIDVVAGCRSRRGDRVGAVGGRGGSRGGAVLGGIQQDPVGCLDHRASQLALEDCLGLAVFEQFGGDDEDARDPRMRQEDVLAECRRGRREAGCLKLLIWRRELLSQ